MRIFQLSRLTQLAWHGLALVVFLCLPVLKWEMPWWELQQWQVLPLAVLLAAYGLSAAAVFLFVRHEGWRPAARALTITLSVFSLFLILLVLSRFNTPRYQLLPVFAAAVVFIPALVGPQAVRRLGRAALSVAVLGVAALSGYTISVSQSTDTSTTKSHEKTAFYMLRTVSHAGAVPPPATRGGGLDRLGDDVLLGTGDGHLYLLSIPPGAGHIQATELPTQVPLNREEFAAAFGGSSRAPWRAVDYSEAGPPRVQTWRFRVADVIAQTQGDSVRIFASHHFWKADEECFVVRVSQLDTTRASLRDPAQGGTWRTLYETTPCITLTGENRKRGKNPFRGEEIGGRMVLLDSDTLLLTLGDHGFYGVESVQAFSQDMEASYGKTIRIDLRTGANGIYTTGHRNAQGLYAGSDGRVWLTEHAAQGGDEVNLLQPQANYGWPLVTYGTEYGSFAWQLSQHQGHHTGFTPPVHAWLPSIGVSNLIGIEGGLFEIWQGNLLAGSLATQSLYRMVLEGDHVVLDERIEIGKRIRDLLELNDGRILLWTDDAALVTIEPASGTDGALQFAALCSGCHQVTDGMSHRLGPDLYRIADRKVASAPGYDEYSPALQQFGGVWSKARLDAFLRDPQAAAPGTTMAFPGIRNDEERAALVEYLETLDQPHSKVSAGPDR